MFLRGMTFVVYNANSTGWLKRRNIPHPAWHRASHYLPSEVSPNNNQVCSILNMFMQFAHADTYVYFLNGITRNTSFHKVTCLHLPIRSDHLFSLSVPQHLKRCLAHRVRAVERSTDQMKELNSCLKLHRLETS